MALEITSGTFQAVAKNVTTTGLFVVNHAGADLLYVEFSTNGSSWSASPTVLGGSVSWTELSRDPGEVAKFTVSLTPAQTGNVTLYMRVRLASGGSWGDAYSTPIVCYQPAGQGFAVTVEQWTGTAWTPATEYVLTRRFGSIVVAAFGRSNARSKYRVNNVEYTCPQSNLGSFIVAIGSGGVVTWTAWVSGAGMLGIDQKENGDIYVLIQAAASNRTFYNQDGTTAYTDVFQSSSSGQLLVAKLFSTGNWSGDRSRVVFTGTQSMGTPQIRCGDTNVVISGPLSSTVTAMTSAGTSVAVGTRSVTTTYALGLSASNLSHVWGQVWSRGTFHRLAVSQDDRAYVATYDSSSFPTVSAITSPNAGGIARFNQVGGILGHEGWPPNAGNTGTHGGLHLAVDTSNNVYILAKTQTTSASGPRSYTDGAVTLNTTATGFSVALWKRNSIGSTTAGVIVQEGMTGQSRAESLSRAVDGSVIAAITSATFADLTSGTKLFQIGTSGLTSETVARHYFGTGDVSAVVFQAVSRDSLGNSVFVSDAPADLGSVNNFINHGSTAINAKAAAVRLITLANGLWEQMESSGGVTPPGNLPDAPVSANWPATLQEDAALFATVTGYDPDNVSGTTTLEVWNPSTNSWVGNPTSLLYAGKGTLTVTYSGSLATGATVTFSPLNGWYGTLRVLARWKVIGASTRVSALTEFKTTYTNIAEPPSTPTGEMPAALEDNTSTGVFSFTTDPDNIGTYTWQLSPQTSKPTNWDTLYPPAQYPNGQPDWHTTKGTTVTVLDGGNPVGTVTVLSKNDATKSATLRFTPYANWNGSASFDLRVSNGLWSDWVTTSVNIEAVGDAPTAVTGDAPNTPEDTPAEFVLSWVDPDVDPADGAGNYTIELAAVAENGVGGFNPVAWSDSGEIDTELAIIRVVSMSETALSVTMRVEPKANLYGTYRFAARVREDSTPAVYGPSRVLTAEIGSVPDAPAMVQGRMPAARWGQSVQGEFTTFDPDTGETYTFQISAGSGIWGSTATVTGGVNLAVVDSDLSDQAAIVQMTQTLPGATVTEYSFYIRVVDSSGLSSAPVRITGSIGAPAAFVWLQRLVRGVDVSTVETRCPLRGISTLSFTESLDGSGYAEIEVSALELARRATSLGTSPMMLADAGSVELLISVGSEPAFVGPITETSWETAAETVRISAAGLPSYFDVRTLPTDRTFTGVDMSSIAGTLVTETQNRDYGSLAISNSTSPAGANATITFEAGSTVADCLGRVSEMVEGPEIWVDASRVLHAQPTRGIDNRARVRLTSGMADVAEWTARRDGVVTAARVTGADVAGTTYEGSYESSTAMAIYGRVEKTFSAPQLLSNAECALLAQRIVEASAAQAQALTLRLLVTPSRPFKLTDLGVGDVITVDLLDRQLGQILGAYRIVNRAADLVEEASGTYQVTLDLEPARYVSGKLVGSRSRHNPSVLTELSRIALEQRQG